MRAVKRSLGFILVLSTGLFACSDDSSDGGDSGVPTDGSVAGDSGGAAEDAGNGADTGPDGDAGSSGPTVQMGTGLDMYVPLTMGEVVLLVQGPQGGGGRFGGFHIWGGIESDGFNPDAATLDLFVLRASDRMEMAKLEGRIVNLQASGSGTHVAHSIAMILDDCCLVVDEDIIMRVELVDADGLRGENEIQVRGGPTCFDAISNMDACP